MFLKHKVKYLTKQFQVLKHLNTSKHNNNNKLVDKSKQIFIKNAFKNQNKQLSYALDLCQAMVEYDISLWEDFLEKYNEKKVFNQSAIRKNYVSTISKNTISHICLVGITR